MLFASLLILHQQCAGVVVVVLVAVVVIYVYMILSDTILLDEARQCLLMYLGEESQTLHHG